jgi:hypothetical protein
MRQRRGIRTWKDTKKSRKSGGKKAERNKYGKGRHENDKREREAGR